MQPNRATEIPATMMVPVPVPSQTINRGARADFGRLFRMTRYGSIISDRLLEYHKMVAARMLMNITRKKLTRVSSRVMPIWGKME